MLNEVLENTERFMSSVPKTKRKKYGQFFTNETTAKFMASLFCFDLSKQKIEILDAGAGTGILAAAVVQKLYKLGYMGKIYVTCYETDELVMPLLEENMALCNKLHNVSYTIKRENYVTSQNFFNSNSPNYRYRITNEFLRVIQNMNEDEGVVCEANPFLVQFVSKHDSLSDIYASKKKMQKMPVRINNQDFTFSPGNHNKLQKAIIEEFAPRFAPSSECLYVGDTIQKDMVKNIAKLSQLGFEITLHDKMPDVVLYREDKNWIYFVESVTSVGPMDPKRIIEIESMTKNVSAGKIYVTAFLDFATFKRFSEQLAWETEVWIADMPDHMIHLNGDKFLGPR